MAGDDGTQAKPQWSRRKKDDAPRGVRRHPSGGWAIRYVCGHGHIHRERIGRVKQDAKDAHDQRRLRARTDPAWCPAIEAHNIRVQVKDAERRERSRVTFAEHAVDFISWAKAHHRSWAKDHSRLARVTPVLGGTKLDEITTAAIERFLAGLREGDRAVAPATVNRYRDLLSGLFKRAMRLGMVTANPVRGIPKLKEPGGRVVYLPPATKERLAYEECALSEALAPSLRRSFIVSVHTGLRWSEQAGLQWRDVDLLTGIIGVGRSKNGYARKVPMNSVVQSAMVELATTRGRPDDPTEPVFTDAYRTVARRFGRAVEQARRALSEQGDDATHLHGYTWHANRHTFASRLVMAGVDLLTVQRLGGWRTLSMVQRYAHLAPGHLRAAVERLAPEPAALARNYPAPPERVDAGSRGVS